MPIRMLTDDDIFISYAHLDGATYAQALADELMQRGFSCFIDRLGTEPGKKLPRKLRRKIRGCAMLVIVGTREAASRVAIEDEIKEFLNSGNRSLIVPIDFGEMVFGARWYGLIQGVDPEPENGEHALDEGRPSASIIGRIEKQFNYTRRNQRLQRATVATGSLLVFLFLASLVTSIYAAKRVAEATEARTQVRSAQAELETSKSEAEKAHEQELTATSAANAARVEEAKYRGLAKEADLRRQEQTRLTMVTIRRADDANEAARAAKSDTEHQQAISDSLRLANQSQRSLTQGSPLILPSVQLATKAMQRLPTVEADSALRKGLSMLPRRQRAEQYAGDILDANLSPDGQQLAILTSENVLRIYKSGDQMPLTEFVCRDRESSSEDYSRQLVALSNDAAYAAVLSANQAIVVNLKTRRSHKINLVEPGFSFSPITMSPDGKYIAFICRRRTPHFNGVRVLDADTGAFFDSLAEDLDSLAAVSFGPNGDLVASGSRYLRLGETGSSTVVADARKVIAWPVSAKPNIRESGTELTRKRFDKKVEMTLPTTQRETDMIPRDSIAIGPHYSMVVTRSVVYKLTGEGYEPVSYIPYTNSRDGLPTGERRYAFNREGTQAIVLTAGSFPSIGELLMSVLGPMDENLKPLARSSRSSWTLESWDLGDYPAPVFQGPSILNVKFESDGRGILVRQRPNLPIRCLRTIDGRHNSFAELEQPQVPNSILAVSPNVEYMVTTDTKTVSVIRACQPIRSSISFPSDLKNVNDATITSDTGFLALMAPSVKAGAGVTIDVHKLNGNQYQRQQRLELPWRPFNLTLSSNGQYLIVGTRQGFKLWDVRNDREIKLPGLEQSEIRYMWPSPDARFLAVFAIDGLRSASTRVLRLEDRVQMAICNYPWSSSFFPPFVSFSPNGRFVVDIGSGGITKLIDIKTWQTYRLEAISFAYNVAFSADERYLAIASQDREVLVYRTDGVGNGPVARWQAKGLVGGLDISPDNRYVAIGILDKSSPNARYGHVLRLLPLQAEDLIREATERLSIVPKSDQ